MKFKTVTEKTVELDKVYGFRETIKLSFTQTPFGVVGASSDGNTQLFASLSLAYRAANPLYELDSDGNRIPLPQARMVEVPVFDPVVEMPKNRQFYICLSPDRTTHYFCRWRDDFTDRETFRDGRIIFVGTWVECGGVMKSINEAVFGGGE